LLPELLLSLWVSALLAVFLGGCTGEFPIGSGDDRIAGPAYFPNTDGSHWSYSYRQYLNNVPYGDVSFIAERFDGEREVNGVLVQEFEIGSTNEISLRPRLSFIRDNEKNIVEIYGFEEHAVDGEGLIAEVFDSPWRVLPYPLQVGKSWQAGFGTDLSPIVIGLPDDIDGDEQSDSVDAEKAFIPTGGESKTTFREMTKKRGSKKASVRPSKITGAQI